MASKKKKDKESKAKEENKPKEIGVKIGKVTYSKKGHRFDIKDNKGGK